MKKKNILEKSQKMSIYSYIASPRADRPRIIVLTNFDWNQFKIFLLELKYSLILRQLRNMIFN